MGDCSQLTRSADESGQAESNEEEPPGGFCEAMANADESACNKCWRIADYLRDRDSI